MKTFDEAAQMFLVSEKEEPSVAGAVFRIESNTDRYREILSEAAHNPRIVAMRNAMKLDVKTGRVNLDVVIWTAFVHGLQIGIEMEKAE